MTTLTREHLYDLVWSTPITKVAANFQVSGTAIAKICRKLDVPKPSRGHWARLKHGYQSSKQPLPKATGNTPTVYELNAAAHRPRHRMSVSVPDVADTEVVVVPERLGRPHQTALPTAGR